LHYFQAWKIKPYIAIYNANNTVHTTLTCISHWEGVALLVLLTNQKHALHLQQPNDSKAAEMLVLADS
jgi:hypothetical protein